ncbi:MAG: hypothetical protein AB7F29_13800 [Candidatus Nitrosocosmicus sp.]
MRRRRAFLILMDKLFVGDDMIGLIFLVGLVLWVSGSFDQPVTVDEPKDYYRDELDEYM